MRNAAFIAILLLLLFAGYQLFVDVQPAGPGDGRGAVGENGDTAGGNRGGDMTRDVLADDRFQRDLPPRGLPADGSGGRAGGAPGLPVPGAQGGERGGGAAPPSTDTQRGRAQPQPVPPPEPTPPREPPTFDDDPPDIARIGETVMWALLAVVGAFFAFFLFRWLRNGGLAALFAFLQRRKQPKPETKPAPATKSAAATAASTRAPGQSVPEAGRPLTEWERLARDGDYAGAVHAILRHSVGLVRNRYGVVTSAELTSREILRSLRKTASVAQPLATIVAAVEFVHFGGRDATEDDYRRCADSLARLEGEELVS